MTDWIQCSDRMPMGEACDVVYDRLGIHDYEHFSAANVETLRREFGHIADWIDRTEWRPLEDVSATDELDEAEPAAWHDETSGEHLEEETLRAALTHFGFDRQLKKLGEEACELAADLFRVIGGEDRPGLMEKAIGEMADVSILIDQVRLVYGEEIRQARARKMARLEERLGR